MAITLRNVKGSELTFEELDGNFTDLNGRVTTLEGSTGLSNVVEDTTPELGGDLVTGTKRLKLSSSGGSMLDFTVTQYSVANNTVLSSVGSINLFLDSASADASGDTAFRIFDTTNPDGTFNENTNIFKIADNGNVTVTGNISVSGTNQIQLGAAQDLSIFHNNNHSIIRETGTGSLYLQSDNNVILSTDSGTKKMVKGVGSGEVILYHNDVQKLNTSTSGVTVVDEVHTEGATPHLTLKRTNNANVPTLRFKGSGGTIGASIDFDGTAGTSNELAFQTFDGATLAERFRVTYTGAKVTGELVLATPGTAPTANNDPGSQGEIRYDDNYLYIKTASGWKRANLSGIVMKVSPEDKKIILFKEELAGGGSTQSATDEVKDYLKTILSILSYNS